MGAASSVANSPSKLDLLNDSSDNIHSHDKLKIQTNNEISKELYPIHEKYQKFHELYSIGHDLGSGAFSVVKLATNILNHQRTAVKIISKLKLSPEDFAALMTEIELLDHLNHSHVIKLYETFDEGNDFYIVTELVEGGELFDRIVSKSHYTEKEARDLIKIFIETVQYIHNNGIVHRDLKPENLLLVSDKNDTDVKIW